MESLSNPLLLLTGLSNIDRVKDLNPYFIVPGEKEGELLDYKWIKSGK